MNLIKRLLRHLWAFWAILFFIIAAIPLFPLTYLSIRLASERKKFDVGMWYSRFWSKVLLWGFAMPVKAHNQEIVLENKPAVIVTNHVSQFDIPTCAAAIPLNFKYLSKKSVTKIPIVGYLVKQLHVLVDRSSKESRKKSMEEMVRQVKAGHTLNLYPEGTRNKGPTLLKEFYDGAFRLAVKTQRPLIPMTITNTWNRENQNTKFQLNPGTIEVYFDDPINTMGTTFEDIPALKEKVKQVMLSRLEPVHGKVYSMR